jgi:hypothetical protein
MRKILISFLSVMSAEGSMSMKQYSLNASKSSHICVSLEEDNEFAWKESGRIY